MGSWCFCRGIKASFLWINQVWIYLGSPEPTKFPVDPNMKHKMCLLVSHLSYKLVTRESLFVSVTEVPSWCCRQSAWSSGSCQAMTAHARCTWPWRGRWPVNGQVIEINIVFCYTTSKNKFYSSIILTLSYQIFCLVQFNTRNLEKNFIGTLKMIFQILKWMEGVSLVGTFL